MQFKSILAATALVAVASAAPLEERSGPAVTGNGLAWYDSNLRNGGSLVSPRSKYTCFTGPASKFPAKKTWASWSNQWNATVIQLGSTDNTAAENQDIKDSIIQVSKEAKVDARIITAMMMQESSGRVRVPCTTSPDGTVKNCGLLQAHNSHSYDPSNAKSSILTMIREGIQGTSTGDGIVQVLNGGQSQGNIWNAERIYNSGPNGFDPNDLSKAAGATSTYVADIANRVLGWDGSSRTCS